jgi:hypothetical protein
MRLTQVKDIVKGVLQEVTEKNFPFETTSVLSVSSS